MAGCFRFPNQDHATDPLADSIVKAVNAHDADALRQITKAHTIDELNTALGADDQGEVPPLIIYWDQHSIGVMLDVAESAFEAKNFDSMFRFLTKLLLSVGFSESGLDSLKGVHAPRIDRMTATGESDASNKTTMVKSSSVVD